MICCLLWKLYPSLLIQIFSEPQGLYDVSAQGQVVTLHIELAATMPSVTLAAVIVDDAIPGKGDHDP